MSGAPRISKRDERYCRRCRTCKPKVDYYQHRRICKACILVDQKFKREGNGSESVNQLMMGWGRA